jgi:hypothetical protein
MCIIVVAFDATPTVPYHIEAVSISDGMREFDCPDPAKCQTAELSGYTPDKLMLTITTSRGSRQYNLAPSYDPRYADGPRCGVTCRSGTVRVALP